MITLTTGLESVERLVAAGACAEARAILVKLAEPDPDRVSGRDQQRLRHWRLKLAPWWWFPLRGPALVLRRTEAGDADFYENAFARPDFVRRYNRQRPWSGDLRRALARAGTQPPLDLGALHWVICRTDGTRCGLASLTSIHLGNSRAEFSIGFPEAPGSITGAIATLLVYDFAFFRLGLNKLYTYVYTDNPAALHNSVRIGLLQEGVLKDHFWLPPGQFVDVHALGLTRAQLLADRRLAALARRWLGLSWTAQSDAVEPAGRTLSP